MKEHVRTGSETASPTLTIAAIIGHLPDGEVEATTRAWHQAFFDLRGKYGKSLPGLGNLEFHQRPGVTPVSDQLDSILQRVEVSALNPTLRTRVLKPSQQLQNREYSKTVIGSETTLRAT